jgi:hypothetical protein
MFLLSICLLLISKYFCQEFIGKTKQELLTYVTAKGGTTNQKKTAFEAIYAFPTTALSCNFPDALKDSIGVAWMVFWLDNNTCFKYMAMYSTPDKRPEVVARYDQSGSGYFRTGKGTEWHSDKKQLEAQVTTVNSGGTPTPYFILNVTKSDKKYKQGAPLLNNNDQPIKAVPLEELFDNIEKVRKKTGDN